MRIAGGLARSAITVLASMLLVTALVPASATAAPDDTAVDLALLGSGDTVTLPGRSAETGLRLPAPDGMTPIAIRGRVSAPAYATRGSVDVRQDDRLLTRTVLPVGPSDVTIPLTGLEVDRRSRSAAIVLSSLVATEGYCNYDPSDAVRISDVQVIYSGSDRAPSTVGEFLPPALTALTIVIPDDVQPAESAAAVGVATAVTARYGTAPVRVTTVSRPRSSLTPVRGGPLSRQIVIATDLPDGLRLASDNGYSYLTIGGPSASLSAQAAFLTSDLSPLAMSGGAIAGQLYDAPQLARDVHTLADLGVTDQRATTDGWPRLTVGIDQTRLARPSHNIRVQMRGTFTPPAGSGGRIVIAAGDRVLDSLPTDASGVYDRWVDIPDDVLGRYTELTVTAEYGGARTACGQADLATLTLASDGEVDADAADPPSPSGLQSMPQALMPRVQLAMTKGDAADVARAVDVMTHLQQMTAVRLGVDMTPVDEASSSNRPAVIIAADGSGLPGNLELPLTSKDGTTMTVTDQVSGRPRTFTSTPGVPFGSIQVTRNNGRSVLVASSAGDASHLDQLLTWLAADPTRWASATGDVIVKAPDHEPQFVTVTDASEQSGTPARAWVQPTAVLVVASVLVIVAGLLLLRRRRR